MCSSMKYVTRLALGWVAIIALGLDPLSSAMGAPPADAPVPAARRGTLQPWAPINFTERAQHPTPGPAQPPSRPAVQGIRSERPSVPPGWGVAPGVQHRKTNTPRGLRRTGEDVPLDAAMQDAGGTGGGPEGGEALTTTSLDLQGSGGGAPPLPPPPPSASFLALDDNATRFNPDTSGAVGPNHLMVTTSSELRIQTRTGSQVSRMPIHDFWAPLGDYNIFDTRLLYDPYGQRWIHLAVAGGTSNPGLVLAVSQGSNPAGSWNRYFIDTDPSNLLFPESPSIGFNKKWIAIQAGMFSTNDFFFEESHVYVLDKNSLYGGGAANFTMFDLALEVYGDAINSQVPAITYDPNVEQLFLVGHWNNSYVDPDSGFEAGAIRIYTIDGTTAFPNLTPGFIPQIAEPWEAFAPFDIDFLPQQGTTNKVAAGDSRIQNVIYRNGSLWVAHTVFVPLDTPTRSAVQWWEVLPQTGVPFQFGRVGGAGSPAFYAYPSIAVNANNDVLIGYSSFSGTQYPSAAYSFKTDLYDAPDVLRPPVTLKAGEAPFFVPDGTKNLWGDWSAAVVDPANEIDMWTVQEYAAAPEGGEDRWGTWWGRVSPDVDLSVSMTGTPTSLVAGQQIQYSITITNFDVTWAATGVRLVDTLPNGLAFVSATSSQGSCSHSNGIVTCNLGDLFTNQVITAQITVRTTTDGQIVNTVVASASGPDNFPTDNTASVTANVSPAADLLLNVTSAPSLPVQGQEMYYTVTVTNLGPSSATTAKFTNYFPENSTFVRLTPSQGTYARSGNRLICTFGKIDPGQSASAIITVIPNGGGPLTNQAYATSSTFDPSLANNARTTIVTANALPVISSFATTTINEDESTGPLPFTVSDLETSAGSLVVTASGDNPSVLAPSGISLGGSGGNRTLTLTPLPNQFGNANVTLQVTDGNGASISTSFLFRVLAVNDAPTVSVIPNQVIDEDGSTGDIAYTIDDVETSPVSLSVSRTSSNTSLIPVTRVFLGGSGANRTVRVEPLANQHGTATITMNIGDGVNITSRSFTVTVNPINDDPTLTGLFNRASNEDTATPNYSFTIGDVESSTANLNVTARSSNQTLMPDGNILLSGGTDASRLIRLFPATNEFGTTTVTVRVADPDGGSVEGSFMYSVSPINDFPYADVLPDMEVDEDSGPIIINLTGIAPGPTNEFDEVTITATSSVLSRIPHPTVEYTSPEPTGRLIATLLTNVTGAATINVRVRDNQAVNNLTTLTFSINILPVNDVPEISGIPDQTIDEDGTTGALAFTVNDVETANGSLTLSATSSNPQLIPVDHITFGGTGGNRTVTATPLPDSNGSAQITVMVSDGTDLTSTSFTLNVNPINDPPTLVPPANQTMDEDTTAGPLMFLVRDPETALGSLTLTATSSDATVVPDNRITLGVQGTNGTVTIQPQPNASGSATVTLTARDPQNLSAMGSFTVTVSAVNDPPTLDAIPDQSMDEDAGPLQVSLAGIGTGAADESQTLVVTAASSDPSILPNPGVTYTNPSSSGMLTLNPAPNANGDVTVTVQVNDGDAANNLASRQFTLAIRPVNDRPTLSAIADQAINEDTATPSIALVVADVETAPANLTVFGFSSNEELIFPDGIQISGTTTNRTLVVQPLPDQFGEAIVFITVEDGDGESATTQFLVTVRSVNDLPTISAISNRSTQEDTPTSPISILVQDVETPPASLTLSGASSNTQVVPNSNFAFGGSGPSRNVIITPAPNQSGNATITLTVLDLDGGERTSQFSLGVAPINDAPTLDSLSDVFLYEGSDENTVMLTGIGTGASNEVQTLTVTATSSAPTQITAPTVGYTSPNNSATLTLDTSRPGSATITVMVMDNGGTSFGGVNLIQRTFSQTIHPTPQLRIWLDAGNVHLAWPATAVGLILESREQVDSGAWTAVNASPSEVEDEWVVTLPADGTSRYYQLRTP